MRLVHAEEVTAQAVADPGASGVTMRWVLARPEGAPNFAMRMLELEPNGQTPLHEHAWEHEVFILEGQGQLMTKDGSREFAAGDAALVLPQEPHQFRNTGGSTLRFLCLIPLPKEG